MTVRRNKLNRVRAVSILATAIVVLFTTCTYTLKDHAIAWYESTDDCVLSFRNGKTHIAILGNSNQEHTLDVIKRYEPDSVLLCTDKNKLIASAIKTSPYVKTLIVSGCIIDEEFFVCLTSPNMTSIQFNRCEIRFFDKVVFKNIELLVLSSCSICNDAKFVCENSKTIIY